MSERLSELIKIHPTHIRYPVNRRISLGFEIERLSDAPTHYLTGEQYEAQLLLLYKFGATQEQLADASECAKIGLMNFLYQDVHAKIHEIIQSAYEGDPREIIKLCVELEELIGVR